MSRAIRVNKANLAKLWRKGTANLYQSRGEQMSDKTTQSAERSLAAIAFLFHGKPWETLNITAQRVVSELQAVGYAHTVAGLVVITNRAENLLPAKEPKP